jgi:hypothetical protein
MLDRTKFVLLFGMLGTRPQKIGTNSSNKPDALLVSH